jgi:hypothetical protein
MWIDGAMHGHGTMVMANGDIYEGNYFKGEKHGKGKYKWKNGATYTGEYVQGARMGYGTFTYPKKKLVQEGYWNNGKFVGAQPPAPLSVSTNDKQETSHTDDSSCSADSNGDGVNLPVPPTALEEAVADKENRTSNISTDSAGDTWGKTKSRIPALSPKRNASSDQTVTSK